MRLNKLVEVMGANQMVVFTEEGTYFQSYDSIVCMYDKESKKLILNDDV